MNCANCHVFIRDSLSRVIRAYKYKLENAICHLHKCTPNLFMAHLITAKIEQLQFYCFHIFGIAISVYVLHCAVGIVTEEEGGNGRRLTVETSWREFNNCKNKICWQKVSFECI